jgi:hypothetical protein
MKIKLARSARKHKIGKAHIEAALKGEMLLVEDRGNRNGLWIAVDDRGVELEIGMRPAVEDADLMIVYHCKPAYRKERSDGTP